jgi:hypothetical protein
MLKSRLRFWTTDRRIFAGIVTGICLLKPHHDDIVNLGDRVPIDTASNLGVVFG